MPLMLLPLLMLLTNCTEATSNTHITVTQYSKEVQEQAAKELEKQGPACAADAVVEGCSASKRLITDYGVMRKKVIINNDAGQ